MGSLEKILSSRVRAEIFRLLFGLDPAAQLHMREMARKTGLAIGTIQHELRQLSQLDLVQARRDGNRLYYSANRAHALYSDIRNLVLKTAGLVDLLAAALPPKEISCAFVFGSFAIEREKGESDVDLVVIGQLRLRRITALLAEPAKNLGREINPYVLTKEEFTKRKRNKDHFLSRVLAAPKIFIIGNENELKAMG